MKRVVIKRKEKVYRVVFVQASTKYEAVNSLVWTKPKEYSFTSDGFTRYGGAQTLKSPNDRVCEK